MPTPLPLITRRRQVAIALETDSGVAEAVPASLVSFDAFDLTTTYDVASSVQEGLGLHGASRVVSGRRSATCEFTTYAFGAAGKALLQAFLPACRWKDLGAGLQFSPYPEDEEGDVQTATLFVFEDGRLRKLAGCAGSFRLSRSAGNPDTLRFSFQGADAGISATAMPAITRSVAGVVPSKYGGGVQSILGQAPIVASAEFDAGGILAPRESAADAGGVRAFRVVGHAPTLEIVAEDQLSAWLPETSMRTDTPGAVSVAGSTLTLSMASAGVSSVAPIDRGGIAGSTVRLVPIRVDEATPLALLDLS